MNTRPLRLNTAKPAHGRYGKDSNEGMEVPGLPKGSEQDTREADVPLRGFGFWTAKTIGAARAGRPDILRNAAAQFGTGVAFGFGG
jgi:hypothetical protein